MPLPPPRGNGGSGALLSLGGWYGSATQLPLFGKSGCPFTSHPDLQIYAVTPIPDYVDVLQMDRVPDRVKSFYRVNNVRKFRYDRPFHKGPKDKENEFKVNKPRKAWVVLIAKPGRVPLSSGVVPVLSFKQAGSGRNCIMACTFLPAEPVDRADHADPDPQLARHLSVVRGGEEGTGEPCSSRGW